MNAEEQLYNRYDSLEDHALIALYHEGGFGFEAEKVLLRVLSDRGIGKESLREEPAENEPEAFRDLNIEQRELYNRYNGLTDEQLMAVSREGGLTPEAEAMLQRVLRERRIAKRGLIGEGSSEERDERVDPGPRGLGGWLVLVVLGLFSGLVSDVRTVTEDYLSMFTDGTWSTVTDPSGYSYHPVIGFVVLWEMAFYIAFVVVQGVLIWLFFRKSVWFPKTYIWFLVAIIIFVISDTITLTLLYDQAFSLGIAWIIPSGIWISYMRVSKRVKNTFVRRGKRTQQDEESMSENSTAGDASQSPERLPLFNTWAQEYNPSDSNEDFPFQGYDAVLDSDVALADPGPGMTVLDLGIGTGNLAARFVPFDCRITGADFSQQMLDRAAEMLPDALLVRADLTAPFPEALNSRFDRIVSGYLFHEFPDDVKFSLIERLLRDHLVPGGRMVIGDISFPNAAVRERGHERWRHLWDESEYYWSAEEMKERSERLGASVEYRQVSECAGTYVILPKSE